MRRRDFVAAVGGATVWSLTAQAQQTTQRVRRIGLMANLRIQPIERFRKKLGELGYSEGKNLLIEYRFGEGKDERFADFAAELAAMPVDLIVAWGTPAAFAAKRATSKIPIVLTVGDVINTGLVSNLARPGGNITGFVALNVDLEEKRLELLKEVMPHLSRVAVLGNSANPLNRINSDTIRGVAKRLSVMVDVFEIKSNSEVERALRMIVEAHPDAVLLASDTLLLSERRQIANAMAVNRIPAIYPFREYAEAGGLIAYGSSISELFERSGDYVRRILDGENPGDLPIQQATKFEVIVNMKAAAKLGMTLPAAVLARADEVIE
jgi:putative ABC transport system substrate-binding protein